jgi:signal transduction histidine kinase
MKIKTKLTLLFTLVIAILLLILNFYIYSLNKKYASNDFFKRLHERIFATANIFLEADEIGKDVKIFREFQEKYLEKLPGETIRVYDSLNQPAFIRDSISRAFPISVIEKVRKEKIYQSKENNKYVYGIFYIDNQGNFVILVSAIDEIGNAELNHLRNVLLFGFIFSIIIVFFTGRFFIRQILKPLREINKQVNTITETNLNLRLNEGNKKDELSELATTFNRMIARIENAFELQQNFVANASHELRTPLTSIIGNIDVSLSKERNTDEYKTVLKTILEEAERLHKLSDGLLNIAQASFDINKLKMEDIRIDELLEEAKDIVQNQMPESKMELSFENMPANSDDLLIKGNKNLLMIAFENLFENANKFSGYKKVKIALVYTPESILITVSDLGIGIPPKDLLNVLQTFSRAENARTFSGSGVGLSLSQKIFLLHNGKLSIQSELGKNTTVSVMLKKVNIY